MKRASSLPAEAIAPCAFTTFAAARLSGESRWRYAPPAREGHFHFPGFQLSLLPCVSRCASTSSSSTLSNPRCCFARPRTTTSTPSTCATSVRVRRSTRATSERMLFYPPFSNFPESDPLRSVMSTDWAPTGREFVSGSYDRTVRLWTAGEGKARDTYHTKRMQRFVSFLLVPVTASLNPPRQRLLDALYARLPLRSLRLGRFEPPHLEGTRLREARCGRQARDGS